MNTSTRKTDMYDVVRGMKISLKVMNWLFLDKEIYTHGLIYLSHSIFIFKMEIIILHLFFYC